jgi:hypothetical protein
MRVSQLRPGWNGSEILLHPWEPPFRSDDRIQAISIDYPDRISFTSGTNSWIVYWFIASMVAAFCAKPWLNVNI